MSRIVTQVDGYPAVTVVLASLTKGSGPVPCGENGKRHHWHACLATSVDGVAFVLARPFRDNSAVSGDVIALVDVPGLPSGVRVGVPERVLRRKRTDDRDARLWVTSRRHRLPCPYAEACQVQQEWQDMCKAVAQLPPAVVVVW